VVEIHVTDLGLALRLQLGASGFTPVFGQAAAVLRIAAAGRPIGACCRAATTRTGCSSSAPW
jgi:hypothetical protein